jgi:hypothetical protein
MSSFRTIDRQTGFLLPPSVNEWLPEKHVARFVVEVIDGLDLRDIVTGRNHALWNAGISLIIDAGILARRWRFADPPN